MEQLTREGRVRLLGVSNLSLAQLELLCARVSVPPSLVQNRCHARSGWDREVRAFCRANGIVYQAFSLLTANRDELATPPVQAIARRLRVSVPHVVFRFALELGLLPLTGTSDRTHMAQDLASAQLELRPEELATLEAIGAEGVVVHANRAYGAPMAMQPPKPALAIFLSARYRIELLALSPRVAIGAAELEWCWLSHSVVIARGDLLALGTRFGEEGCEIGK